MTTMKSKDYRVPAMSGVATRGSRSFRVERVASTSRSRQAGQMRLGAPSRRDLSSWIVASATVASVYPAIPSCPQRAVVNMPDFAAHESDRPVPLRVEPHEDLVEDPIPYIAPLASYRVQGRWGEVRDGVPAIFPEDLLGDDE